MQSEFGDSIFQTAAIACLWRTWQEMGGWIQFPQIQRKEREGRLNKAQFQLKQLLWFCGFVASFQDQV